jgi:UDP-glucose 4-epimerase
VGKLPQLAVSGNDYPTPDGTGVRDYIHVVDLAQGHMCALRALAQPMHTGAHVYNLGTGQGYSVMQMVRAFEAASGRSAPDNIARRRPGDIATCYANTAKAESELEWKAQRGLDEMMREAWRWVQNNPDGYKNANKK